MASQRPTEPSPLDFNLRELLDRWPILVPVFVAYRPLCIGCTLSEFHTARIAAEVYGDNPDRFIEAVLAATADGPET